jgi:hypothetical protein
MTFWQQFITTLGGFSVVVLALAWLVRSLVTHVLSKDVETFKASLKAQADIEIERLKATLQMEGYRDQVRFGRLHEKQANTLALLYEQLLTTIQHLESCASWTRQEIDFSKFSSEAINKALSAYVDAKHTFKKHEIYFDPALCALLNEFLGLLKTAVDHTSPFDEKWKERWGAAFLASWEQVTAKLPEVSEVLRTKFREILGVEETSEQTRGELQTGPR